MKKMFMISIILMISMTMLAYVGRLEDYDQGMKLSRLESKQLIVMFSDKNCYYCSKFIDETLPDKRVQELLKAGYIFVEIYPSNKVATLFMNGEEHKVSYDDLFATYGVNGTPTFWFFNENGDALTSLPGFVPANEFIQILQYLGEKAYANGITYADYVKEDHDFTGDKKILELPAESVEYVLSNSPLAKAYTAEEFDPFAVWIVVDREEGETLIEKGAYRVITTLE